MSLILAALTVASTLIPLWQWDLPDGVHLAVAVFAVILLGCGIIAIAVERAARNYRVMDGRHSR